MMEKNRKKADKTEENRNDRVVKLGTAAVVWVSAAVCAYLFFSFVITGARVPTSSMEPTIKQGDIALVNGLVYVKNDPQRGDIVIFKHDGLADGGILIKRIIGLPGDSVTFADGYVYINGEPVYESYLPRDTETNSFRNFDEIPQGCYFVLGDNREDSLDSRFWDDPYVKRSEIRGKLMTIIPLTRMIKAAF